MKTKTFDWVNTCLGIVYPGMPWVKGWLCLINNEQETVSVIDGRSAANYIKRSFTLLKNRACISKNKVQKAPLLEAQILPVTRKNVYQANRES